MATTKNVKGGKVSLISKHASKTRKTDAKGNLEPWKDAIARSTKELKKEGAI